MWQQDHLKRDCRQDVPRNNVFSKIIRSECPALPDYAGVSVAGNGLVNVQWTRGIFKVMLCNGETP